MWIVKDKSQQPSTSGVAEPSPGGQHNSHQRPNKPTGPTTTRPAKRPRSGTAPSDGNGSVPDTSSSLPDLGESNSEYVPFDDLNWVGTKTVSNPFVNDGHMGGFYSLEEVDDVDVEYEAALNGSKIIKFKRRSGASGNAVAGSKKKKRRTIDEDPVAVDDTMEFIHVDDFVDGASSEPRSNAKKSKTASRMTTATATATAAATADEGGDLDEVPDSDEPNPETLSDEAAADSADNGGDDATPNMPDMPDTLDMSAWADAGLAPEIVKGLAHLGFRTPTKIQSQTLEATIDKFRDIIGAAETGSGKTLAFSLPIIHSLATQRFAQDSPDGCHALILTPTRELAMQITDHIKKVSAFLRIKIAPIVGGISVPKQRRLIASNPNIVVATPGRLMELISEDESFLMRLCKIRYLVLDEADRMLEHGHFKDLDSILQAISLNKTVDTDFSEDGTTSSRKVVAKRQTFVFSATLLHNDQLHKKLKGSSRKKANTPTMGKCLACKLEFNDKQPLYINVVKESIVTEKLLETKIECVTKEKDSYLYYILARYPGKTLVFVNSIDAIRRLLPIFTLMGVKIMGLHAEMQQRQRLKNLDRFRDTPNAVLVASDVAARGLDIPQVEHVVHYQLPRTADLYVHRSGRTARANNDGVSVMLCSPEELSVYKKICHALGKAEGLSDFPVDLSIVTQIKERLALARQIDSIEHSQRKEQHEKAWFEKAALEADIELDDDLFSSKGKGSKQSQKSLKRARAIGDGGGDDDNDDTGHNQDGSSTAKSTAETKKLRGKLSALLAKPLMPRGIRGTYLTSHLANVLIENQALESQSGRANLIPTEKQSRAVEDVKVGKKAVGAKTVRLVDL
ncbi:P-loop containing nucleoside triphosphate hydrolase protein [Polychytrium aggregatum]|uniref:P-loop containing nucleoside triphosphate hydrolase protein n=1 Tax=Polychytrium aggregatum TaxID=110093 RepID=UPI0022FEBA4E|nr:P-loop containing nucleoside triphosphate hydrolase protein [Polychytrium aggregatum]KAI9209005.1 P-loop containing nucleoside triphosphate hydrolase protein [Polychytrium aggregatum]